MAPDLIDHSHENPENATDRGQEADTDDDAPPDRTDEEIQSLLAKKKETLDQTRKTNEINELINNFTEQVLKTNTPIAEKLNKYVEPVGGFNEELKSVDFRFNAAEILFSGFAEGDFSERAHFQMPVSFSGGFFIRTKVANFLVDPGNGTITGLREAGVNLSEETDIVIASHYHPSARLDMHTIFNMLGGYCPGRIDEANVSDSGKKVYLFSTKAVLHGRNDHPPVLIPSDKKVIASIANDEDQEDPDETFVTRPGKCWKIARIDNAIQVEGLKPDLVFPIGTVKDNELYLKTFEAFHSEAAGEGQVKDEDGLAGKEVGSFFLQGKEFGIFFTGDTEYREEWAEQLSEELGDAVTVLVCNTKTIDYLQALHENKETRSLSEENAGWPQMGFTYNQLGFLGTLELARYLGPKVLVMRAFGLECMVEKINGVFKYAPHKLAIIRESMEELIKTTSGCHVEKVIIPGRHRVVVKNEDSVETGKIVRGFTSSKVKTYGKQYQFNTVVPKLAREIDAYIQLMQKELERSRREGRTGKPYLVIQGESGGGKTLLAKAIGEELDSIGEIITYDLATAESNANLFQNDIFGWERGLPGGGAHPGILGAENTLIIFNQLEKLPANEAKKFLDILEEWKFRRFAGQLLDVKAMMVFTTNIDLEYISSFTEDFKNRLRHRLLTIPRLSSLKEKQYERALTIFTGHWCDANSVILDQNAWKLIFEIDLSKGAFRTLNGMLHKARLLVEREYGIVSVHDNTIVYVAEEFLEKARIAMGIPFRDPDDYGWEKLPCGLTWTMATWLSNECVNKKTYMGMKGPKGGEIGSPAFKNELARILNFFKDEGDIWKHFLTNQMAIDAFRRSGDISDYIECLDKECGNFELCGKFSFDMKQDWLEDRSKGLKWILNKNTKQYSTARKRFMNVFQKQKKRRDRTETF